MLPCKACLNCKTVTGIELEHDFYECRTKPDSETERGKHMQSIISKPTAWKSRGPAIFQLYLSQ